jgi:hypothetical protein
MKLLIGLFIFSLVTLNAITWAQEGKTRTYQMVVPQSQQQRMALENNGFFCDLDQQTGRTKCYREYVPTQQTADRSWNKTF